MSHPESDFAFSGHDPYYASDNKGVFGETVYYDTPDPTSPALGLMFTPGPVPTPRTYKYPMVEKEFNSSALALTVHVRTYGCTWGEAGKEMFCLNRRR